MEMDERMSKRLWLFGVVGLVLAGLLMACGSKYNASSQGLLLVGSQGSSVIQTFSFNLSNGHAAGIANSTNSTGNQTCILNGTPGSMVTDPNGTYAYTIINQSAACQPSSTGIQAFKINSDGTITAGNSPQVLNSTSPTVVVSVNECNTPVPVAVPVVQAPVVPVSLSMDAAGKFLFVADSSTAAVETVSYDCGGQHHDDPVTVEVPGTVTVFSIGSGGTLTEVAGSPFSVPVSRLTPSFAAVAATPTVFPKTGINGVQNAVCQVPGNNPPTTEFLYAVDATNYLVWEFSVDTSTGVLGPPDPGGTPASFAADSVPAGVAVDPCDRFVYVSNSLSNKVSAYTICNGLVTQSPQCTSPDGTLIQVAGSPFASSGNANGLGQIVVDPFGNNVYVVGTLSNTISAYEITGISGSLQPMNPAVIATGNRPISITIRADDNWMFVSNFNSASVSQYSITPATGALAAAAPITTDNWPFGVAVK
jgi:6-phosphogluconolactonase (cycloisomerase 2 family)